MRAASFLLCGLYWPMCVCVLLDCRAVHVSGIEDLLLYLASSDDERQFAFHVLEIISLMFREQVPYSLSIIQ